MDELLGAGLEEVGTVAREGEDHAVRPLRVVARWMERMCEGMGKVDCPSWLGVILESNPLIVIFVLSYSHLRASCPHPLA